MNVLLIFLSLAQAGGFYDPQEISTHSTLYKQAADVAGSKAQREERRAQVIAGALVEYEESIDLLGSLAPQAVIDHQNSLKVAYNRDFAVLKAFVYTMLDDFDAEFTQAMVAAVGTFPDSVQCAKMRPMGKALPGLPQRMEPNPECKGRDLNKELAEKMDGDPALNKAIKEILALTWPEIRQSSDAQAATSDGQWISLQAFLKPSATRQLQAIRREDKLARADLELALTEEIAKEERSKLVAEAREITKAIAKKRAELVAATLQAVAKLNDKRAKKNLPAYSWCATPKSLGGCTGTPTSEEEIESLRANKKVQQALP